MSKPLSILIVEDEAMVALDLIERSVPFIIHTGMGMPPELAATHPLPC